MQVEEFNKKIAELVEFDRIVGLRNQQNSRAARPGPVMQRLAALTKQGERLHKDTRTTINDHVDVRANGIEKKLDALTGEVSTLKELLTPSAGEVSRVVARSTARVAAAKVNAVEKAVNKTKAAAKAMEKAVNKDVQAAKQAVGKMGKAADALAHAHSPSRFGRFKEARNAFDVKFEIARGSAKAFFETYPQDDFKAPRDSILNLLIECEQMRARAMHSVGYSDVGEQADIKAVMGVVEAVDSAAASSGATAPVDASSKRSADWGCTREESDTLPPRLIELMKEEIEQIDYGQDNTGHPSTRPYDMLSALVKKVDSDDAPSGA